MSGKNRRLRLVDESGREPEPVSLSPGSPLPPHGAASRPVISDPVGVEVDRILTRMEELLARLRAK